MSIKQIALIEITRFGSDVGLYVDGSYVTSADPGCGDSTDAVISMAENLAASQNLAPDRIQVAPDEEWQWDDVSRRLQEEGKLRGGLSEYLLEHTVLVVGEDGCELDTRAMKFQAEDQYHAIEQMVDHYRSMRTDDGGEFLVRVSGMDWDTTATLHQDGYPSDYVLAGGDGATHIMVGNVGIQIKATHEGVIVDAWDREGESCLGTLGVMFSDACVDEA